MNEPTDPHPFVFVCVNGFLCENGSNQAAREISIATFDYPASNNNNNNPSDSDTAAAADDDDKRFHCETFIIDVFDSHDHLLYHFSASDQIRNILHSQKSGFPRPVRDREEFLKYYETFPDDDDDDDELFRVATYRGDSTLSEAQSKVLSFLQTLIQNRSSNKIYIGAIKSFEYPFFEKKFFSPIPFREIDIEFVVYDQDTLEPLSVYSSKYPADLVPPEHGHYHRNFDGYPFATRHGCTITRTWFYLKMRKDPFYLKQVKFWYEYRKEKHGGRSIHQIDEYHPIDVEMVYYRLNVRKHIKGHRIDGWCRPIESSSSSDMEKETDTCREGEGFEKKKQEEDEKEEENTKIIEYNTYCKFNIVP